MPQLANSGDTASATPSKRTPRNKRAQLQRQIEAVTAQLKTRPRFGHSRQDLERELDLLCAQREALGPLECNREHIKGVQLRSRQLKLEKRPTSFPSEQRSVEDLAVSLASPKRHRPSLTRRYS